LNRLEPGKAQPIASAGRFEIWRESEDGVEFELTGPDGIKIVSRVRLPKQPRRILIEGRELTEYTWHKKSQTLFFESPAGPLGQVVKILW
jgi:hypothetical protein